MRKISMVLVAAMLLSSGSIFANSNDGSDPAQELKKEVKKLLNGFYEMQSDDNFKATVLFTVNKEKEIVVLSVYSEDLQFKDFVKNQLNYHKIKTNEIVEGRRYSIPVEVKL